MEIARGLHHLHHKRIIHFDLKSANVLLTRDGTAKIAVRLAMLTTCSSPCSCPGRIC